MRGRNWVVAAVLVAAVIAAATLAGHRRPAGSAGGPRPQVHFGSQVERIGATRDLVFTNGWVASGGGRTIGVYAGRDRADPDDGLLVVVRQTPGRQKVSGLVVHGSGAVTLLRPAAPATGAAAFGARLRFVTANGGTGTLDLSDDRVALNRP